MTTENIETTIARLDERFKGFQSVVAEMAKDMGRMSESYEKLVENNQRVALLEADMLAVKTGQIKLWEKYDAMAADALKTSNKWIGEFLRMILTAGVTILLYKLGVHP